MARASAARAGVLDDGVRDLSSSGVGNFDGLATGAGHELRGKSGDDCSIRVVVTAAAGDSVLVVEGCEAVA